MYGLGDPEPTTITDRVILVGMSDKYIIVELKNNGKLEFTCDGKSKKYLELMVAAKQSGSDIQVKFWPKLHPFSGTAIGGSIVSLMMGSEGA